MTKMMRRRRLSIGLLFVTAVGLMSCGDGPVSVEIVHRLAPNELTQYLTPVAANLVTTEGMFMRNEPAPNELAVLSRDDATRLAVAFIEHFGPYVKGGLERQHGAALDLNGLRPILDRVYLAETPYEPLPHEVMRAAKKHWGAYFIVIFEQGGVPCVKIAVSVHATDMAVVQGHLTYVGDQVRGNEFRWEGIPRTSPYGAMVGPEHAVKLVAALTGTRVADRPLYVRQGGFFTPFQGFWEVQLERPVIAHVGAGRLISTRVAYVDAKAGVYVPSSEPSALEEVIVPDRWAATLGAQRLRLERKATYRSDVVPATFAELGGER